MKRIRNVYGIVVSLIAALFLAAFLVVFIHAGYHNKVLAKLGIKDAPRTTNWAVYAWNNCLTRLEYDADIAFFGDSITANGNFEKRFDAYNVINLGYPGDTIAGMIDRVAMVAAVNPEIVFVHGGINGLTNMNYDNRLAEYAVLLDTLSEQVPDATIYVQSVLPISKEKELSVCSNETIVKYNNHLRVLCEERKLTYIDLHSLYVQDGILNPALAKDGVHLKEHAYTVWENAIAPYIP